METRKSKFIEKFQNGHGNFIKELMTEREEAAKALISLMFARNKDNWPTFEKIQTWYKLNLWSKERVEFAFSKGVITEEQKNEILKQEA